MIDGGKVAPTRADDGSYAKAEVCFGWAQAARVGEAHGLSTVERCLLLALQARDYAASRGGDRLLAVLSAEGLPAALERETGASRRAVYNALKRLHDLGLIERSGSTNRAVYALCYDRWGWWFPAVEKPNLCSMCTSQCTTCTSSCTTCTSSTNKDLRSIEVVEGGVGGVDRAAAPAAAGATVTPITNGARPTPDDDDPFTDTAAADETTPESPPPTRTRGRFDATALSVRDDTEPLPSDWQTFHLVCRPGRCLPSLPWLPRTEGGPCWRELRDILGDYGCYRVWWDRWQRLLAERAAGGQPRPYWEEALDLAALVAAEAEQRRRSARRRPTAQATPSAQEARP